MKVRKKLQLLVFSIFTLAHSFGACLAGQDSASPIGESRQNRWRFYVDPSNVAQLLFPTGRLDVVRIVISKADTKVPWHIQLNQELFSVKFRRIYILSFRARADRVRNIVAAVSKAHEPWDTLGLYKTIGLTTSWQNFDLEFRASADDDIARIHFDVGGNAASVELSDVALRLAPQ